MSRIKLGTYRWLCMHYLCLRHPLMRLQHKHLPQHTSGEFSELHTCAGHGSNHQGFGAKSMSSADLNPSSGEGRGMAYQVCSESPAAIAHRSTLTARSSRIYLTCPAPELSPPSSLKPASDSSPAPTPLSGVRKAGKLWNAAFSHPIVPRCCKPLEDRVSRFDLMSRSFFSTEG